MMRLTTAGESHGRALCGILECVPAGMAVHENEINQYLALRQGGYGRSARSGIEKDEIVFLSGVRDGVTLGSPVAFVLENRDHENWKDLMSSGACDTSERRITRPRPGHADLVGMGKYGQTDARNVAERAGARESAARVAGGSIARAYLGELGIALSGRVVSVCGIRDDGEYPFERLDDAKGTPLFMLDAKKEEEAMRKIDLLARDGDTAGGTVEIRVRGLKSGFGGCMRYAERLDSVLCAAMMSVQAVKGVEVGAGFGAADRPGSEVQDEIFTDGDRLYRRTNNAGGIEGGMSNGEEIVLRAAMKPIPTSGKGLRTVDTETGEACLTDSERSDVCALPAVEIILESVVALALSEAVRERLGGDTMAEVRARYAAL